MLKQNDLLREEYTTGGRMCVCVCACVSSEGAWI